LFFIKILLGNNAIFLKVVMQMIDESKDENWGGSIVIALFLIWAVSGCASMEAYVGVRRSDTSTETRSAVDKPLRCFFTDCGGK
jgi:hypothetical protein